MPTSVPTIDALVLGCALALEVTGNVSSVGEGAERAREAITSGAARDWLAGLAAFGGAADDAVAGERGTDR
jgi:anthranilate phosphoribosyltransferase